MKLLNRSAFAVLPRQPFADWASRLQQDPDGLNQVLSLAEHRQEGTVYLIDEVADEGEFQQALERHWAEIFDNELAAWDEIGDSWPQNRSLQMFLAWFELQPQVLALDLARAPLMTAALED
ncbi:hypothetical protein [Marinobacterium arenosum]|uniref:hypothetical protein n=1 Tax=Marinobacterium arenosum TaxID=2862496 RepID=UPI001C98DB37|nr:hypothetical protein [Marinobacterium arenosum]MBY4678738.1 hypothetical protein [Marinobacterium arenosum]